MPLVIGNKKLIPAPLVNLRKQMTFTQDGRPLNTVYQITLDGTLLPNRGSPTSQGWFSEVGEPDRESFTSDADRHNSILRKQEWLKEGLSATGYKLSWSAPGTDPIECYPRLIDISFAPGTWVIQCPYQVTLEAPYINRSNTTDDEILYVSGTENLNLVSINDDYQIQEREDGQSILEVSRTISATAALDYTASGNVEPWERAKTWVHYRKNSVPFGSGQFFVNTTGTLLSGTAYNFVENESINKLGGQYSLSQKFTFNNQNYIHTQQINRVFEPNKLGDNGPSIERISVNGEITGLDPYNIPANKLINASGYYNTLISTLAAVVNANGEPSNKNVTFDINNGVVRYDITYINNSGIYYKHNYDVNYIIGNDFPTVTIQGTIEGYTPDDFYSGSGPNYTKFDNAISGWTVVSGTLKTLAFAHAELLPTGSLYSNNPISQTIGFNEPNGTISYSLTYPYTSGASVNYQHLFNINFSTQNGGVSSTTAGLLVDATIDGQIIGTQIGTNPLSRLDNAKAGWDILRNTLYTLVNTEYSLIGNTNIAPLHSGFVRRTVTSDQQRGQVSYSASFNNLPRPSSTLVAIEDITVEDTNPTDVNAIHIIPGRVSGPIIQNIATTTERRRSINVALTMLPKNSSPYYWNYSDLPTISSISSGLVTSVLPTGNRTVNWWILGDTENWQYKNGFYTRNVNIVF